MNAIPKSGEGKRPDFIKLPRITYIREGTDSRTRGGKSNFKHILAKLEHNSFLPVTISLRNWNLLPNNLRDHTKLDHFEINLNSIPDQSNPRSRRKSMSLLACTSLFHSLIPERVFLLCTIYTDTDRYRSSFLPYFECSKDYQI